MDFNLLNELSDQEIIDMYNVEVMDNNEALLAQCTCYGHANCYHDGVGLGPYNGYAWCHHQLCSDMLDTGPKCYSLCYSKSVYYASWMYGNYCLCVNTKYEYRGYRTWSTCVLD